MSVNFFRRSDWTSPNRSKRFLLTSLFLSLSLALLTRNELANGFTILLGDRYDGVISTIIMEHWFQVFIGEANWSDVSYFFPSKLTIANTDAYFLNSLAYFPFRLIGMDPFISAELVNLVIKSTGFLGTYFLCRKVFSMSFYWAILAAILFTLSNGMTVRGSRLQLATVAFFPIMTILMWSTINSFLASNNAKFRRMGLFSGAFFAAWCLTCFYMAWFFTFFFTATVVTILLRTCKRKVLFFSKKISTNYISVLFVLGASIVFLIPFFYAFIPKSLETGGRSYEEAHAWTVPLEGILQVGEENYLLGRPYNILLHYISPNYVPFGEYYNTGFPVVLFCLFILGSIQAFKNTQTDVKDSFFLQSVVIGTLCTWLFTLNIFGYSAWYLVFHFFPGAKALRVVSTYQIFLALPVIIVAVKFISTLRLGIIATLMLCTLLTFEEINSPSIGLDRRAELDRISLSTLPPKECHVFYTSGWKDQENLGAVGDMYAHNVSAMFFAQIAKIPTINGVASFMPSGWNFSNPGRSDYDERALYYAKKHKISGLCKFDLNKKEWQPISDRNIQNAFLTVPFFKKSIWEGHIWTVEGLYPFESWGTWSSGEVVSITFDKKLPKTFEVHLTARAFGPNIGKDFEAKVGDKLVKFNLNDSDEIKIMEFYNPLELETLQIKIPFPASPKELGASSDDRKLGIGIVELRIIPR